MAVLLLATLIISAAAQAPYYPPDPTNVPRSFACAWRSFALEYSTKLLPASRALAFDALQLGVLCNASLAALPQPPPSHPPAHDHRSAAGSTVWVDAAHGSDSAAGTEAAPLASLAAGVALSRTLPRPVTVLLRAATYYLAAPLVLTAQDSQLTIAAHAGEEVWVTGAQALPPLTWRPHAVQPASLQRLDGMNNAHGCQANAPADPACGCTPTPSRAACEVHFNTTTPQATSFTWHDATTGKEWENQCCLRKDGVWAPVAEAGHFAGRLQGALAIYVASVPGNVSAMPELRVDGVRYPRARYPNANPETDIFPKGWFTGGGSTWKPPKPSPPITPVSVFNAALALRNSSENRNYSGALGGACHVFDPPFSYWCSEHPAGGGGFQYYVPSGATLAAHALPNFTVPAGGANPPIFHLWRAAHWANWAFEVEAFDGSTQDISFGIGGFQGARGGPGSDYFVENALELLDAPTEWFYDPSTQALYLYTNETSGLPPPAATLFEVPLLASLLRIDATQGAPARNISLMGLGFKDSAPSFMSLHAVPSGGDWALERIAAVLAEGVEGLQVSGCNFSRMGGNALMISGYARDTLLTGNTFRFTGGSAMVGWGRTDEVSQGGALGWDATAGDYPLRTTVTGNLASEVGVWMKQNSCWAQFKTALTTLEGNVCFNVGRAGFNFNDGLGGGDQVVGNLIFNTNRESADHGVSSSPFSCCSLSLSLSYGTHTKHAPLPLPPLPSLHTCS